MSAVLFSHPLDRVMLNVIGQKIAHPDVAADDIGAELLKSLSLLGWNRHRNTIAPTKARINRLLVGPG